VWVAQLPTQIVWHLYSYPFGLVYIDVRFQLERWSTASAVEAMWSTISFCLFSLVLTGEWVSGRLHLINSTEGPKERRIDKMPPCVHDEVLYIRYVVIGPLGRNDGCSAIVIHKVDARSVDPPPY